MNDVAAPVRTDLASSQNGFRSGVARTVLGEQVKEVLLGRILRHEYMPGERLVASQIARDLNVSLAPVREALRQLEALRFATSEPFRGTRVHEPTPQDLSEIYPVRAALEAEAIRVATLRLAGNVSLLEEQLAAMHAAADAGDVREQATHDVIFHRLIVEAAGNRILLSVWQSLGLLDRTVIAQLKSGLDPHEVAATHRPIVDAVAAQNADSAEVAIRRHLRFFQDLVAREESAAS